ncbi:DUF6586 family protein [Haliea sp. E17]|uniref:DUF6586 family protein n=1 Tax=Haliea sp. E17 TaxID=3401576 RepID=UPI003AABB91B
MAYSARGQANHCLYLARILGAAWRRDSDAQSVAASTLAQAYLPAVRMHLQAAYGWFLLDITRQEPLPALPPGNCADLPPRPAGKVLPGEIRECQQLERDGWLAEMLSAGEQPLAVNRHADNLASTPAEASPQQVEAWCNALQGLFERMGNSLDEY